MDPLEYAPLPPVNIRLNIKDWGPQGVCPTRSQKTFRSVPRTKGLKMLLSSDDELKWKPSPHGSSFEFCRFLWGTL